MIDREDYFKPHMCPVCGKFEFPTHGSYEICEECGWEDDGMQETDPESGGANWEGLAGSRALYQAGKHKLPTAERRKWLTENGYLQSNNS